MSSQPAPTASTLKAISLERRLSLWSHAGSELSMGLIIFSADSKRFYADKKAAALFGVTDDGEQSILAFKDWLGFESVDFFDRLLQALADDIALDELIAPKLRLNLWIRMVGAPRGAATERGFLVWDRTAQVQNESRLHEDRLFFETVLNAFLDPVTITGSDLKFIYGNTAFSALIGLIPEEYYGRTMADLGLVNADVFHGNDHRCLHEHIEVESEEVLDFGPTGTTSREQLWLVKRVPYSAPNGRTTIVSVFRDIREVRRMQLELDRSRARSSHIARLKGLATLAAGVAHELNNPLMIASGAIEAVAERTADCPDRALIESQLVRAARGIQRAAEIVLAMQKMGAHTVSGDAVHLEVDVCAVIESVRLLLGAELTRNAVTLRVGGVRDAKILGSESALIRIVAALVQNAIESIAAANSVVRVVAIEIGTQDHGSTYNIAIADSGVGISTEHQEQIFEPFYSTKEIGQGLGLGLSLAKESAEAMGGHIEYGGAGADGGARFIVVLKAFT